MLSLPLRSRLALLLRLLLTEHFQQVLEIVFFLEFCFVEYLTDHLAEHINSLLVRPHRLTQFDPNNRVKKLPEAHQVRLLDHLFARLFVFIDRIHG